MQRIPSLFFGPSPISGRGVFTSDDLPKGILLEICPVILLPKKDFQAIHNSHLHDYYFAWTQAMDECAIALGFGSLYNHACPSNAEFEIDYDNETIDFRTVADIPAGTEITVNYNGHFDNRKKLWF